MSLSLLLGIRGKKTFYMINVVIVITAQVHIDENSLSSDVKDKILKFDEYYVKHKKKECL